MTKPDQRLVFAYDYMGRRWKKEVYAGTPGNWTLQSSHRYLYDGFVQITELDAQATYAPTRSYRWDPTVGKATRVLSMTLHGANVQTLAFTHDGNKNTDSLIADDGTLVGHYAYGPFGQVIAATGSFASVNPYRFSSEFEDGECGLVYYNCRYFVLELGRWVSRDPVAEEGGCSLYCMVQNDVLSDSDVLGLSPLLALLCDCAKEGIKTFVFNKLRGAIVGEANSKVWHMRIVSHGHELRSLVGAAYFLSRDFVWYEPGKEVREKEGISDVIKGCLPSSVVKRIGRNIPLDDIERSLLEKAGAESVNVVFDDPSSLDPKEYLKSLDSMYYNMIRAKRYCHPDDGDMYEFSATVNLEILDEGVLNGLVVMGFYNADPAYQVPIDSSTFDELNKAWDVYKNITDMYL